MTLSTSSNTAVAPLVQTLADRIGADEAFVVICIGLTMLFGAVGGSVFPLMPIGSDEAGRRCRRSFACRILESSWIGAAGALGFLFFEIALGAIKSPLSGDLAMRVVCVSVIAGYGSRRLLPMASNGLANRIAQHDELIKRTEDTLQKTIEANEALKVEVAQLEDFREDVRLEDRFKQIEDGTANADDFPDLVQKAVEKIEKGNASTSLVMYLARYYKRGERISDAAALLEKLLDERGASNIGFNKTRLFYNLACYYALLAAKAESPDMARKAVAKLEAALSDPRDQTLRNHARTDPDLQWLREKGLTNDILPAPAPTTGPSP